ncbi:Sel1-repeat containing protein [Chondrus crispus]|uniref:Sel1-repeat containing protein n=1 Tax=Chondrus crispus TaxID=2769 RepID=R7QDY6_CHOCR|nr:Sel1-repeat containing protein [Chondrus crispus]CDF35963.1 Sel1-repeat containing protein [Chondrus crispus]|eukprot:XP_005715782.1 Sel1-repeat containing protein [Chondrus crispus]
MESVRSSLAAHLPKRGGRFHEPPGQWKQSIQFLDSDYLLTDAYESVLSESLTCALRSFEKKTEQAVGDTHKSVLSRPIQLRLLWELQTEFQRLANDVRKPQQISSMIACILAFPSLTFTSKLLKRISTRTSRLSRSATNVEFHSTREVFIRPVCAPQNFYLVVSVICGRNTPASVSVQLAREDCTSDNYFDWEAWRDAFNGRLRGLKGWQKAQGMSVFEECTTYASIRRSIERWKLPDPRTGSQLRIWAGWLPHRPVIAKYELGTEGLIRQYAISGNGAEEGKPIDYAIASREDLRYSLGAVEERIFQVQRIERESKGEDKPHPRHTSVVAKPADQFLEQGKKLLDGKKGNIPLALQYFELAARNGNVDGLRYAVDLLMDKTSGHVNLNKALFLTKRFDWMLGTRDSTVQERAQAIEEIYQKLLTRTRNACSVVLGFAAFELQRIERMEFNGAMSTGDVMNILAQSFRQSGHIETLRYIVILSVHSAWLRANINPLGTTELLPVTSWGSWLISSSSQRAMLGNRHFRRARGGRSLLEIFFYTAGKSTRDWEWLDAVIQRDDIMRYIREDALEEIIQKKDKGAPERNKSILRLLRRALKDYRSSAKASILLGEIYENGVVGIDPSLQSAIEVYGEGARQANLEATERLGAILKRLPQENQSCRFKILEALRESESPKNARASFVLGDWYEHGLGGVQTDLHQAIQLYGKAAKLHDKLAAERLGDIVRQDWTETDGAHQSALKLLQEAARDRDENSALILGGIYEAGLKGLVRDCGRAVELYHIGLDQGNYESSERLRIIAQSKAVECMVLRHQIIERLYDSVLEGNAQAARVLGNLCENGLDIVASNETALSQLCAMKFYDSYVIRLLGSVAMRKESKALPIMQEILQALFGAAELGISDAAVALANIKEEEKNIADAVEVLGIAAVSEGDVTSISRLGKMALEHNGSVKARVMQILHEASDLDHIHAIAVQALVLQKSAKGDVKTRYMSKAVEFFAKAAHTGHDGAVVLLRNIAFSHCGDEHGRIALENLIDVAWREGCSETCATQALDAVGYVLDTSQCSNSENAAASLDLFQEVSGRVYSHQYSSFHQLEVAFSAARGLKALTTSGRSTKDIKEQARLRLQEYAEDGREGPMEFFAGCLLNEVPMDEENMPEVVSHSSETRNVEARNVGKRNVKAQKALQLYADLIKMERAKTSRRGLGHDEKATRIGEAEIKGMRRGVALLESPGLTSEQDAGLRDQLLKRCNILETKVKGHRAHLRNLANILEWH